jgi:hypothetical protein
MAEFVESNAQKCSAQSRRSRLSDSHFAGSKSDSRSSTILVIALVLTATFEESTFRWESRVLTQHKPSTQATIRSHIRKHLAPYFGPCQMKDSGTEEVQMFVSSIKLSAKTKKNLHATMQMLWKSARAWGYVAHDAVRRTYRRGPGSGEGADVSAQRVVAGARDSPKQDSRGYRRGESRLRSREKAG